MGKSPNELLEHTRLQLLDALKDNDKIIALINKSPLSEKEHEEFMNTLLESKGRLKRHLNNLSIRQKQLPLPLTNTTTATKITDAMHSYV